MRVLKELIIGSVTTGKTFKNQQSSKNSFFQFPMIFRFFLSFINYLYSLLQNSLLSGEFMQGNRIIFLILLVFICVNIAAVSANDLNSTDNLELNNESAIELDEEAVHDRQYRPAGLSGEAQADSSAQSPTCDSVSSERGTAADIQASSGRSFGSY